MPPFRLEGKTTGSSVGDTANRVWTHAEKSKSGKDNVRAKKLMGKVADRRRRQGELPEGHTTGGNKLATVARVAQFGATDPKRRKQGPKQKFADPDQAGLTFDTDKRRATDIVKKVIGGRARKGTRGGRRIGEGRRDGTTSQRAFAVGQKMADKEHADSSLAGKFKKRRAKLKKAGHRSVSAGMADRSKELRGEK